MKWYVYIVRCKDGTFYTGCAKDVEARINVHNSGKGAKYTYGRRPVELVYREECENHSAALTREAEIKKMTREEKFRLIKARS